MDTQQASDTLKAAGSSADETKLQLPSTESGLASDSEGQSAGDELISVIVPVYDDEKYISQCLGSLLKQDGVLYEIIVVLDQGSRDGSADAIRRFDGQRIIRNFSVPHCTIGHALNFGVSRSRGTIIAFAEADKYFEVSWLKNAMDYLRANPAVDGVGSLAVPPVSKSIAGRYLRAMKEIHLNRLAREKEIEWAYVTGSQPSKESAAGTRTWLSGKTGTSRSVS